jgi:hypothetical protein
MISRAAFFFVAGMFMLSLATLPGQAGDLSPEKLDMLDQMGYFTPGFKTAVHDFVDSKHALEQASAEKAKLTAELPDLQKQAMATQAQAIALRQELSKYDHPEENDFVALQWKMKDPGTKPEEQMALAQAYVWTYPTSPHEGEAQLYLHQLMQQQAEQRKAIADAQTAREIAHASLVERALAHNLNLEEWRNFLRDMSEDDLVKLFGRPTGQQDGYWIYAGNWVVVEGTQQKYGMMINFNAGRVISVDVVLP